VILPLTKAILPHQRFQPSPETVIKRYQAGRQVLARPSVRLLTWNIAKNTHLHRWQQDFFRLLHQHQPDLIFLQEVRLCAQTYRISALTEITWHFAPNFLDTYHNTYSGVLTATNLRCLTSRALLSQHAEPIASTPKVALLNQFVLAEHSDTLLTVNAHLINFVELAQFRAQLDRLAAQMAQHSGPIIFAGDFNTWNRSRWSELLQMTERLGLIATRFPQPHEQHIKRFLWSPPLDYIFYRGFQAQPLQAQVFGQMTSSDHKPLLVELAC
jgi:endonuclease/exonuclease/phosphatase (EEP) superfamily protein YafD